MLAQALIAFHGIEEKRDFSKGEFYEFADERARFLAGLGFVKIEGEQSPSPTKKKRGRK